METAGMVIQISGIVVMPGSLKYCEVMYQAESATGRCRAW